MAKMGRPEIALDEKQLKGIMRLKPTLKDVAAFFDCSPSHIEKHIRREYDLTFSEFRDQNMVHTRFSLIRKAIQKAEGGDNTMLIFCLKNLCGWSDKKEDRDMEDDETQKSNLSKEDILEIIDRVKKKK